MEHSHAEVFAFPAPEPLTRLRMALRSLVAALEEQRNAVADFRTSLQALRGATEGLGASLATYQSNLKSLDSHVRHLGQTAVQG